MDKAIEELLRQGRLGITLTSVDWNILLQEASDDCSLDGVLIACHKLQKPPTEETLENLLLTALCRGDCDIAIRTCAELGRNLANNEKNILVEGAILSGNVQGMSDYLTFNSAYTLSMFHTAAAIAVCLQLRKRNGLLPPDTVSLKSWAVTYARELSRFNLVAERVFSAEILVPGQFYIFNEDSRNKLIGALLITDTITEGCAEKLLLLDF